MIINCKDCYHYRKDGRSGGFCKKRDQGVSGFISECVDFAGTRFLYCCRDCSSLRWIPYTYCRYLKCKTFPGSFSCKYFHLLEMDEEHGHPELGCAEYLEKDAEIGF